MADRMSLWQRWKKLARAAAAFQSNVLLWLLYYLVFFPLALLQRPFTDPLALRRHDPAWRTREMTPPRPEMARRQF